MPHNLGREARCYERRPVNLNYSSPSSIKPVYDGRHHRRFRAFNRTFKKLR